MSEDAAGIRIEGLEKSFGSEQVLQGLDLTVEPGEFCVLIGPSGSGKSTVLKCVAGLFEPDAGRILVDGDDMTATPVRERGMGFVFQEFDETLFPHMTVGENVAFGLRQADRDYSAAEIDERIAEILKLLAIPETRDDPPDELSGGQQQRVELARQLVRECEVMLFDDPLADLDYKLQKRMELELRRLHADVGGTHLYVTHNQDQALKLADKVVVIHDGRIEQVGPPLEVYEQPANAYVGRFVGDNNLLTARVVDSSENGTATAETPVGTVTARAGNELDAGTEGVILVRPEDIALGTDASDVANRFTARPRDRTYTGEMTEFVFAIEDTDSEHELQVIYSGNVQTETFRTADGVPLGWEATDAVCFSRLSATGETSVADLQMF
jgi:ABC-type Fe3+/spermidine/putrescine transport system ATPase subunit